MAKLFLVRHGKSTWNDLGLWTGHTDVELTPEGEEEARRAGLALRQEVIHRAHVSPLKRTRQTLSHIQTVLELPELDVQEHPAIMERHYGIHTGKNKWQVKEEIGEEAFQSIRRGWDTPIPEGETLKDVYERVKPYYEEHIKSDLMSSRNVLVVAHGNSLRALVKHLENLSEEEVVGVEIATGEVHCYTLDENGAVVDKVILPSAQS
jgi:2,3-bisphosphoglycerate-dependent phosphoglycerate mutase